MKHAPDLRQMNDDEFAALVERAAALPDAPPAWRQLAHAAWRQSPMALPGWTALGAQALQVAGRHLKAALSFDSWATTALASGLRGVRSDTRQLVFSVEGRDIDLRIVARGGAFSLSGQVLGPDESGTVLLLAHPSTGEPVDTAAPPLQSTSLDDLGEFHLNDLPEGRYALTLKVGDDRIDLPAFDVGIHG